MTILIDAISLCKSWGDITAASDISLQVPKGEVLGFLGPNGAGKSTTMKMITGYLIPDAGEVIICGYSMAGSPIEAKRNIGYLPEGSPIYNDLDAMQFFKFSGEIRGMKSNYLKDRIDYVINRLSLEKILSQKLNTLSKGYKRRVGLAAAILHDPAVLILDEPTDGLDPLQKIEVRKLIKSMAEDKAIIISTHILEEVDAICSRTVIISNGQIIADGTAKQLVEESKHKTLEGLFVDLAS